MDIDRRKTVFKKGGTQKGKCYNCGGLGYYASSCFKKSNKKQTIQRPKSRWQKKGFKRKQVIPDSESEDSEEEVDQQLTTDNKDFQQKL